MKKDNQLFELFWENSKLNNRTIRDFAQRISEYAGRAVQKASIQYPGNDVLLKEPNDKLLKFMTKRKSVRELAEKKISFQKLSSLFASFMKSENGTRTFASAGATYALEIFCILNNVEGELNNKIVYYNFDNHSLTVIKDAPPYEKYKEFINVNTKSTIPPLIFVFTLLSDRTTYKYGERGGRFVLIELGQAVQNLSLRLVQEGMVGVEAGGLLDDKIAELLGIDHYPLNIALGYLCGYPFEKQKA